ncbi:bifunctional nuclease family protein [Candidatus Parcubacteria bacterium]|nr:MAG: bifunctional nuclease family protein [Candidatus Parcubacteria bacterium]
MPKNTRRGGRNKKKGENGAPRRPRKGQASTGGSTVSRREGNKVSSVKAGAGRKRREAPLGREPQGGQIPEEILRLVHIVGIEVQGPVGEPMVVLKEEGGDRVVPIWIGPTEAQALYVGWRKIPTPRPLTPDLLLMVMRALGGSLERVVLTTVALNTYFARLEIRDSVGVLHTIDTRPSDAMALAVRAGVPLLATEEMLSRSGIHITQGSASSLGSQEEDTSPPDPSEGGGNPPGERN